MDDHPADSKVSTCGVSAFRHVSPVSPPPRLCIEHLHGFGCLGDIRLRPALTRLVRLQEGLRDIHPGVTIRNLQELEAWADVPAARGDDEISGRSRHVL